MDWAVAIGPSKQTPSVEGRARPGWPGARQNWAIGALAHEPYRQAVANTRIGDLVASTPKPGGPRPAQKIDGLGV